MIKLTSCSVTKIQINSRPTIIDRRCWNTLGNAVFIVWLPHTIFQATCCTIRSPTRGGLFYLFPDWLIENEKEVLQFLIIDLPRNSRHFFGVHEAVQPLKPRTQPLGKPLINLREASCPPPSRQYQQPCYHGLWVWSEITVTRDHQSWSTFVFDSHLAHRWHR